MKLPLKRGPNDTKSVQDSYDFTIVRGYTAEQERSNLILNLHQLQAKADKLKRSRRRRLLDNALPPDPEDSVTQLIYPIGIESLVSSPITILMTS